MASRVKVLQAPHLFFSFCRRTGGSQKPRLLPYLVSVRSLVGLLSLSICDYRMAMLCTEVHFNVSSPLTQITGVNQANDSHNHFLESRISIVVVSETKLSNIDVSQCSACM